MKLTMDEALVILDAVKAMYYDKVKTTDSEGKDVVVDAERVLPFGLKYRLTKIKETLEKETSLFTTEREALIRKYGEEVDQEDGQKLLKVTDENMATFSKEINEILMTELDTSLPKLTEQDVEKLEEKEIPLGEIHMRVLSKHMFA